MKSFFRICVVLSTVLALGTSFPPYMPQQPGFYHEQPKFYQQPHQEWISNTYQSQQAYPGVPAANIQHVQTNPGQVNTFSTNGAPIINRNPQIQHGKIRTMRILRPGGDPITYKLPIGDISNYTVIHLKGNESGGRKGFRLIGNAKRGPQATSVQSSAHAVATGSDNNEPEPGKNIHFQGNQGGRKYLRHRGNHKNGSRPINKKQNPRNRRPVPYMTSSTRSAGTPAMTSYNAEAIAIADNTRTVAVASSGNHETVAIASTSSDDSYTPVSVKHLTAPGKQSHAHKVSSDHVKTTSVPDDDTTFSYDNKAIAIASTSSYTGSYDRSSYSEDTTSLVFDKISPTKHTKIPANHAHALDKPSTDSKDNSDSNNKPVSEHSQIKPISGKQTHTDKNKHAPVKPTPNSQVNSEQHKPAHVNTHNWSGHDTKDSPTRTKNPSSNDSSFAQSTAPATSDTDSIAASYTDKTGSSTDSKDGSIFNDYNDTPVSNQHSSTKSILSSHTYNKNKHEPVKLTPNSKVKHTLSEQRKPAHVNIHDWSGHVTRDSPIHSKNLSPDDSTFAQAITLATSDTHSIPASYTDKTGSSTDSKDGSIFNDYNDTPVSNQHSSTKSILSRHTYNKNKHEPVKLTPNSKVKHTLSEQRKPAHVNIHDWSGHVTRDSPIHSKNLSPDDSTFAQAITLATSDTHSIPASYTDKTGSSTDSEDGPIFNDYNDTPVSNLHSPAKSILSKHIPNKNKHATFKPTSKSKAKPTSVEQHQPAHVNTHNWSGQDTKDLLKYTKNPSLHHYTFAQATALDNSDSYSIPASDSDHTAPDYTIDRDDAWIAHNKGKKIPTADDSESYDDDYKSSPILKRTTTNYDDNENNNNNKQSNLLKRVDGITLESDESTPTEAPGFLTTFINLFKVNKHSADNARLDDLSNKLSTEQMTGTTEKSAVGYADDQNLSAISKGKAQDDTDENVEENDSANQKKASKKKIEDVFIEKHTFESYGADYDKTDAEDDAKTGAGVTRESDIAEEDQSPQYESKTEQDSKTVDKHEKSKTVAKYEKTVTKDEITDAEAKYDITKTKHETSDLKTDADADSSEHYHEDQIKDPPLTLLGFLYHLIINANKGSVQQMFESKRVKEFIKPIVPFIKTD